MPVGTSLPNACTTWKLPNYCTLGSN